MTITASILSYNSIATLPDVIAALDAQTLQPDRVVIVDNASSDGTVDYIEHLPDRIERILLEENLGVGAGHNAAWKVILDDPDCEFIWTLENDSIPPEDCLQLLADTSQRLAGQGVVVGAVTPRQVSPGTPPSQYRGDEARPHPTMTFNGALLRTSAISNVGFIREDFFMDQEDREYASRMNSAGFGVYRDPNATVVHLGKGSYKSRPPSVLRTYYRVRNETFTRRSLTREPWARTKSMARAFAAMGRTLLVEDDKIRRIRARWAGTVDGIRGDLGKKSYGFLEDV